MPVEQPPAQQSLPLESPPVTPEAQAPVDQSPPPVETPGIKDIPDSEFPTVDQITGGGDPVPPTAPSAEPVGEAAPTEPIEHEQPAESAFHDKVLAAGIQGANADNAADLLLEQLHTERQQAMQMRQQFGAQAELAQQQMALQQDPAYQQWRAQQQQAAAPTEPEAPRGPWNPGVNPDMELAQSYMEQDENGNTQWRIDPATQQYEAPAKLREEVETLLRYRSNFKNRLNTEPDKVFQEMWEHQAPDIPKMVREELAKHQTQSNALYETEKIVADNRDWLVQVDPVTGQEHFTPSGQAYADMMQQLDGANMTLAAKNAMAIAVVSQQFPGQQGQPVEQPPQPTADQQAAAQRAAYLTTPGGEYSPNRNGSEPQNGANKPPEQNPLSDETPGDLNDYMRNAPDTIVRDLLAIH